MRDGLTMTQVRELLGFLSGEIAELHAVEVSRLAEGLARYLAQAGLPAAACGVMTDTGRPAWVEELPKHLAWRISDRITRWDRTLDADDEFVLLKDLVQACPPHPEGLFEAHTRAVSAFLNELYAIMVDPCAEGTMTVGEMKSALLAAAVRDRDLVQACPQRDGLLSHEDSLCGCGYRRSLHLVGNDVGVYCEVARLRHLMAACPTLQNNESRSPDGDGPLRARNAEHYNAADERNDRPVCRTEATSSADGGCGQPAPEAGSEPADSLPLVQACPPNSNLAMEDDHCDPCITALWCSRHGGCLAEELPPVAQACPPQEEPQQGVLKALGDCYMMAKREQARLLKNPGVADAKALERWQHVLRFCESTGLKSSILRASLPTEITDGSEVAALPGAVPAQEEK